MKIKKGVTLVELIISITILAVAATAIYSTFANGVAAWRRGNRNRTLARTVRITSEKMARDLRNTFQFNDIPFEGEENFVMFPGLILTEASEPDQTIESYYQVGRIAYFFDKNKKALCKEEKPFPQVAAEGKRKRFGEAEVLVEGLRKIDLSYCYLDNTTGRYKWKDDWRKEDQDSIPLAVKIKLLLEKERQQQEFEKVVFIPIGTGEQKKILGTITKVKDKE